MDARLQASSSGSILHCRHGRFQNSSPFVPPRIVKNPSLQWPGSLCTNLCKHHKIVENPQGKSIACAGRLLLVRATARPISDDEVPAADSLTAAVENASVGVLGWMDAFYRFTRPHTVIGTAIGIVSISLLAVQSIQDFSARFTVGLIQALIPALFMNFYIVGLNQIFDIDIDKSLGLGAYIGSMPLLWALLVSFILGTAYSIKLPFLRWKRSAFAAASCILSVRAIVVQLAFYMHMQSFVLGRQSILTKPLMFATGFMCFFSIVIALFKDIPDLEGDQFFGIQSYTVRLGQERVFWLCIQLLLAAYGAATLVGCTSEVVWARMAMVIGHGALAGILWRHASRIDLKSKAAITSFYMFVWKLFYAEYLLIPLMR